jgi:drug/metabolite transporter (DMT)-like permease
LLANQDAKMGLKVLFGVCLVGFLLGCYQIVARDEFTAAHVGQLINSIFFLLALFGYAFKKKIIHRYFSIVMFLWNGVGYLFVTVMFLFMVLSSTGIEAGVGSVILMLLGYGLVSYLMYIMFCYSFRSPDIWSKNET